MKLAEERIKNRLMSEAMKEELEQKSQFDQFMDEEKEKMRERKLRQWSR